MFENLQEKLQRAFKTLRGQATLTEENIQEALRQIRLALLEADVNFKVVKQLIDQIRAKAIGQEVMVQPGANVPTFVLADYKSVEANTNSSVNFFSGKEIVAASYADVLGKLDPLPQLRVPGGLQVAQLSQSGAAPFVSGDLVLTPLSQLNNEGRLVLIYALARQKAYRRPWISEGLAHLAQLLDIQEQHGRSAALEYLKAHGALLLDSEARLNQTDATPSTSRTSLVSTTDDLYLQSKAMA